MQLKKWPLVLGLILFLTCFSAIAEIADSRFLQPSPAENWLTLETPHFSLHFKEGHREYTQRLAQIAEYQHASLTRRMQWTPRGKTHIVVNDSVDFSNGAATIYPYNRFFVYMNEPDGGELQDRMDFAEMLFIHEYTHILHLDQAEGAAAWTRRFFGKAPASLLTVLAMPQVLAPHWLSEGIAIFEESSSGYGRNDSARFEAMMREEVRTGLADFTEQSYEGYYNSRWPFGQVYLYGAYFFRFLAEEYGEATVRHYISNYNRNIIPWQLNKRARLATGKNATKLWAEFQRFLDRRFADEIAALERAGLTQAETLYDQKWTNRLLTPGPDGSVFFYHENRKRTPQIIQLFPDGTKDVLISIKGVTALRWHPTAGLLISRPQVCGNTSLHNDLYRLNLQLLSLHRLTNCARLPRADWTKDGLSIVAVKTSDGRNSLVHMKQDGSITELDRLELGESIGQPEVLEDGRILAAVKRSGHGWGLEVYDPDTQSWQDILRDNSVISSAAAAYSKDEWLFVSDHDGRVELRSIAKNGKTKTLTRSHGYIHEGVAASDGAVWISQYTGEGDVIRRIAQEKMLAEPLHRGSEATALVSDFVNSTDFDPAKNFSAGAYSPMASIGPKGWAPLYFNDGTWQQLGFQIEGSDVLGFHRWMLSPIYASVQDKSQLGGVFFYSFNDRLSFLASRALDVSYVDDDPEEILYDESKDQFQLLAHYPVNQFDWAAAIFTGLAIEETERFNHQPEDTQATSDTISGIGFSFNNLTAFPHAITKSSGLSFALQLESFDFAGMNSDHSGEAVVLGATGNLRFDDNQTLTVRLSAGSGGDGGKSFELGDSQDAVNELGGITRLGQREFALRGYSQSEALTGKSFLRSSLAWHFPLASIYDGWSVPPLGLGRLQANVFIESGDAWDNSNDQHFLTSVGAELRAEILIGYDSLNVPLSFGYAHGLDEDQGEDVFYVGLNLQLPN